MHIPPVAPADDIAASLLESEQRYRLLFERAPAAMWVFDVETLRILAVNDAALAQYGYTREEFLALPLQELRPPSELGRFWRACAAMRAGHEVTGTFRHRHRNGRIIEVELATRTLPFGDGRVRLTTAREIVEAQAENAARFLDGATRLLTGTLDLTTVCRNLSILAVPRLGDWCAVHRVEPDGSLTLCGCSHVNPLDEQPLAQWLATRTLAAGHPLHRARRTRRAVVLRADEYQGPALSAPVHAEVWDRGMGVARAIHVPIQSGNRVLAVMECVTMHDAASSPESQVALAEELGIRAGVAIDNALLYEQARDGTLPRPLGEDDALGPGDTLEGGMAHAPGGSPLVALRVESVIESMLDCFIAVDDAWRLTYVNRGAERVLGSRREEMVGHVLWELFPGLAASDFGAAYRRSKAEQRPVHVTGFFPTLDAWFDVCAYPVQQGLLLFFRNTSDAHVAREEKVSVDRALRDCLEGASDLVHMNAPDGRILFANAAWRRCLGYDESDVGRLTVYDLVPPEWHATMRAAREACLAGHPPEEVEIEVLARDGRRVAIRGSVRARCVRGELVAMFGIFRETASSATMQARRNDRAAEVARRARAEFLHRMRHQVRTPLTGIIGFARLLEQNPTGALAPQDLEYAGRIGRQGYELLTLIEDVLSFAEIEADREELRPASADLGVITRNAAAALVQEAARRGVRIETDIPPVMAPLLTDASRLQQVVHALLDEAIRGSGRGTVRATITVDDARRPRWLEVSASGMDGRTAEGMRFTGLGMAIAHSLARALGYSLSHEFAAGGGTRVRCTFEDAPPLEQAAAPASGPYGQADALLHTVVSASPLGIVVYDPDFTVRLWNDAATRIFGWSAEEVLGRRVPFDTPDADGRTLRDLVRTALERGPLTEVPATRRCRDGRTIEVHASIAPLRDAEGRLLGFVSMLADVTEKKRVESALRQAQKMEVVGRLAGGIAHDFNNLLTVIRANASFLLEDLPPDEALRTEAGEIVAAADRAAALTRQLLVFARKDRPAHRTTDVGDVLHGLETMLRRLVPSNIELAVLTPPVPCHTEGDPSQLEQVVMNLVLNARDAMPDGGTMVVELEPVEIAPTATGELPVMIPDAIEAGTYVRLAVTDSGIGMDAETQRRVFEPFFTTKAAGQGTGLGLATVHWIVTGMGGHLRVQSAPGAGTTIEAYLPSVPASDDPAEDAIAATADRTPATVLLVEDQDAVRLVAARMLRSRGCTVIAARHGRDALAAAESYRGTIDVLVTDVVMPEMDGRTLAARMRERFPGMAIVFISGYSERTDGTAAGAGELDRWPAVPKPVTAGTLAAAVDEALRLAGRNPG